MPRITEQRREANRASIVAAARRCFAREGFHQTSMPAIAAEAGVSVGAPYRYFASKEEIIIEIAGDAFKVMFDSVDRLVEVSHHLTVADLVTAAVDPISGDLTIDRAGQMIPVEELLSCTVQVWGELLRHDGLRQQATEGFERVRLRIAEALRHGQRIGSVPGEVDPDRGARIVIALLHGFLLQRTAFGLDDTLGFTHDIRALLDGAGLITRTDR